MTTHLHWVAKSSASGYTIEREILEEGKDILDRLERMGVPIPEDSELHK